MPPGQPARVLEHAPHRDAAVDRLRRLALASAAADLLDADRLDALDEAAAAVRRVFGPEVGLDVERFVDPESEVGPDLVVLTVRTTGGVPETMRRMQELDDDYWLDASDRHGGWLMIRSLLA